MARLTVLSIVVTVALLSPACSGSAHQGGGSAGASPATSSAAGTVAASDRAALQTRMSGAPGFAGEQSEGAPSFETAEQFMAADSNSADKAAFTSEHLVAVAALHLKVPGTTDGLRAVYEFADATGASMDLKRAATSGSPTVFAVGGIPAAEGTQFGDPDGSGGARNVIFAVGRYEYVVGFSVSSASTVKPPSESVIGKVADDWYARIRTLG